MLLQRDPGLLTCDCILQVWSALLIENKFNKEEDRHYLNLETWFKTEKQI